MTHFAHPQDLGGQHNRATHDYSRDRRNSKRLACFPPVMDTKSYIFGGQNCLTDSSWSLAASGLPKRVHFSQNGFSEFVFLAGYEKHNSIIISEHLIAAIVPKTCVERESPH